MPGSCSWDGGVWELGWPEVYNVANEPCAIELFFVNFNSIKFKRKKKERCGGKSKQRPGGRRARPGTAGRVGE